MTPNSQSLTTSPGLWTWHVTQFLEALLELGAVRAERREETVDGSGPAVAGAGSYGPTLPP